MSIPPPPGPHQPEGQQPQPGPQPEPGVPPQPGPHLESGVPPQPDPYPQPGAHLQPGPYPQPGAYQQPGPYPQGGQGGYGQSPYAVPYGQSPYRTWGQGYSPYNRPAPVNGLAIASLVLGILCCLPGVGLVLGLVALRQIRGRGERGRGMAVTGSVLSGIGLALWVLALATGGVSEFWEGVKEGARDGASFSLSKGDCFNAPGGSLEGVTYDVDEVDCDGRHDAEVFAGFDLTGSRWPGVDAVTSAADDRCYGLADTYAMDSWAVPDDVDVYYLTPTRSSWSAGDREVTCMFGNIDEGVGLTGSLRNDETVLDADQVAYLKAAGILNAALDAAPDSDIEDDVPGHKAWAGRVSSALSGQTGLLRDHEFSGPSRKPVAALLEDLEKAEAELGKATAASDEDAFYEHYANGFTLLDPERTVTARKALGLATDPPHGDPEPGDGGESTGDDPAQV